MHCVYLSTILAAVFSLFWLTLATSTLVYRALPGTPWPNILDRSFVNLPNSTLHILLSVESSISTITNCTRNTALLSESVSRTYFSTHWIVFHHFVGPNELSIRDVDSIAPLMSSNGFQRGPCKLHMPYPVNMSLTAH